MNQHLDPKQQAVATRIYADGVRGGLSPARAKELALAAMHESSLRADAQGPPVPQYGGKRAGGVMQLLSPGYVNKANQHGGVFNVDANVGAILPDYLNYWKSHPNAPVGAGAAAVERSGQGAGYYGAGMDELSFLGGGGVPAGGMGAAPVGAPSPTARRDFALAIAQNIGSHKGLAGLDLHGLLANLHAGLQAEGDPAAAAAGPAAPAAPGAPSGSYVFPVAGQSNFTDTWGASRPDIPGGHHEGTDIFAPRGTPVVAIQDGVVTKMGPSAIGGNRVWINGKFYYAHLDKFADGIKPGVHVKAGTVLGFVGDTGDAKGTPTHLHFGWSPDASQGASWANPYKLLAGLHGR